jgi:hypothetical protein
MKAVLTAVGAMLVLGAPTLVSAQDVPTVRYGIYEPGFDSGFLLMAQEKEFWVAQGVNVEVVTFKSAAFRLSSPAKLTWSRPTPAKPCWLPPRAPISSLSARPCPA